MSIKSFPRNGTHPPLSSGHFSFWTPYVILQHKGFEIDIFILEKDVLTFLQISIEFYLGLGLTYVDKIRLQMEMDKATGQFWDFFLHKDEDVDEKFYRALLPWRNWLARSTVNRKVGGSSPPGSDDLFSLSQLMDVE